MDCTFIGIVIAGLTAPVSGYFFIGQLTVIYGFVATCIVLPIVFKRLKAFPLQTSIKPNTSTICAPFSLVAAAYVIAFPKANTFYRNYTFTISSNILFLHHYTIA